MLHWALNAAALFLFLVAVRTLFQGSRTDGTSTKRNLGCGFALVAAGLWAYALSGLLGSFWAGLRFGLGALLILPAVQAVARPDGGRLVRAGLGLILGVLLAGPVVADAWRRLGPDGRPDRVIELEETLERLRASEESLERREEALFELRAELKGAIAARGQSWEEMTASEEALEDLERLRRLDDELERTRAAASAVAERIPLLEEELRRAADVAVADGEAVDDELEALLRSIEEAPPLEDLSFVERHARLQELEELYQDEF